MTVPTLTIGARKFFALVDPVIPFAGTDDGLPVLSSVQVESRGTHLVATATDRYRLGLSRLPAESGSTWPDFKAVIPLRSLRAMKSMFKPLRGMDSELTFVPMDDRLRVEAGTALVDMLDAGATFFLNSGEFPKVGHIIRESLDAAPVADTVRLNPKLLAAITSLAGPSVVIKSSGPLKPVMFTSGDNFIGIIMPRNRVADGEVEANLSSWKPLLDAGKATPSKPAVKSTRKTAKTAVA